jgi:hypothetical protein
MGAELDMAWYEHCVKACDLKPDLEFLPKNDATRK